MTLGKLPCMSKIPLQGNGMAAFQKYLVTVNTTEACGKTYFGWRIHNYWIGATGLYLQFKFLF